MRGVDQVELAGGQALVEVPPSATWPPAPSPACYGHWPRPGRPSPTWSPGCCWPGRPSVRRAPSALTPTGAGLSLNPPKWFGAPRCSRSSEALWQSQGAACRRSTASPAEMALLLGHRSNLGDAATVGSAARPGSRPSGGWPAGSSARDQLAVVAGKKGRDRRGVDGRVVDGRVVEACLDAGLPG